MDIISKLTYSLAAGAALTFFSVAPTLAGGVKIYPVTKYTNYCPAGLQPVTIDGTISCGVPNQHVSYQQVARHPVPHRVRHHKARYSALPNCAEGIKGCS